MRYFVEVGGRERVVSMKRLPDGTIEAEIDGRTLHVEATMFGKRDMLVRVDGRVLDVTLEGAMPQLGVVASGLRTYLKVESERLRAATRAESAGGGGKERDVRAPMPGRVVKVLVAEGDEVAAGQSIAVVEAMKMENDVRAKKGGTVTKVHVKAGSAVEGGAVLVSFG